MTAFVRTRASQTLKCAPASRLKVSRPASDIFKKIRNTDMSDPAPQESVRKDWQLTQPVFRRLLRWLDQGPGSEGQQYLEMRRRLVAYFDRKNCSGPDDLADETLNRVARRLEEEGHIEAETPA